MPASDTQSKSEIRSENRQRLMEIVDVVRKHDIVHGGMTPDKMCAIIEELGPTFIKLGQILSMRSDILPKEYCEALTRLRSSVAPMPYSQVASIVEGSYGRPISEVFQSFDEQALGSASIAQVHAAVLQTGEQVVVKVQREGIHDIMSRDIMLLKQACKLLKYTPVSGMVDFNQVLDEMWVVAQEEMNFQTEAGNLEKFHKLNEDVAFVTSPILYREYTTTHVLVMERVDGMSIDDLDALRANGYDPSEIGAKLADNYIRQIMEDGFFHADPHPGNMRIRDGKIVWLDMGMMGTLSDRERTLISHAITGIARGDIDMCRDAVLGLGEFKGKADKRQLYRDIEELLDKYGSAGLGDMDLAKVFEDLTEVMKVNGISMPASLTMLARGLTTIEGAVAALSPDINVMQVVTARIGDDMFKNVDWRGIIQQDARAVYESAHKSLEIPALLADVMRTGLKGEAVVGIEHRASDDMSALISDVVFKVCAALIAAALIICGGTLSTTASLTGGICWYTIACFIVAAVILGWAFWFRGKEEEGVTCSFFSEEKKEPKKSQLAFLPQVYLSSDVLGSYIREAALHSCAACLAQSQRRLIFSLFAAHASYNLMSFGIPRI